MKTTASSMQTPPLPHSRSYRRLRWWVEIAFVLTFYGVYSAIRNVFGSASVSPERAFENAELVIRFERAFRSFQELRIQSWFLDWQWFMWTWNVFYGTFHFVVTIYALVHLYRRHPTRYMNYRNALACTTGAALIGFSLFPLMPPRLLDECTEFGGCAVPPYGFVDSLAEFGGLWSFDSGAMQSVSNQYAAMPSLHFAWAAWCCFALLPVITSRTVRGLLLSYPWLTLFAIVVTGNHYWLDAAGGAFALAFGFVLSRTIARLDERYQLWRLIRQTNRV